jgi:subtilisin-like proprotein convertase family protein
MKKITILFSFLLFVLNAFSQSTTLLPDRVSVPKMTTVAKNALANKTEGMMVYDANLQQFSYWTGTTWANFGSTALGTNGWQQTGQNINYTNIIGTSNSNVTYSNTTNLVIPDNNPSGVSGVINVPLFGNILNPNAITISLALNHTWCSDIVATLFSPSGNSYIFINRLGMNSATTGGFSTDFVSSNILSFNNLAGGQIMSSNPIAAGTYLPSGGVSSLFPVTNLSNLLNENINGNWTLKIQDLAGGDTGNLVSWSLNIGSDVLISKGKLGINTINPQAQLDVNGDLKVSPNSNWNVGIKENNNANIELRQVSGGGTPYIDFSNDATSDYDSRIILSGNTMLFGHAATNGAHVFYNGLKTLFSINGDGSAELFGGLKTQFSGSVIVTPPGTGNQLFNLTIPAVPAGWDLTNTVVLVSCADGGYGQIGQVKLLNTTTIEIRENVSVGGITRYNYIIFKL